MRYLGVLIGIVLLDVALPAWADDYFEESADVGREVHGLVKANRDKKEVLNALKWVIPKMTDKSIEEVKSTQKLERVYFATGAEVFDESLDPEENPIKKAGACICLVNDSEIGSFLAVVTVEMDLESETTDYSASPLTAPIEGLKASDIKSSSEADKTVQAALGTPDGKKQVSYAIYELFERQKYKEMGDFGTIAVDIEGKGLASVTLVGFDTFDQEGQILMLQTVFVDKDNKLTFDYWEL